MKDIESLAFEAFVKSIHRLRWLFLATIIISGILLIDSYLGQLSFTKSQVVNSIASRITSDKEQEMGILKQELIRTRNDKDTQEYKKKLIGYAEQKYIGHLIENTLESIKLDDSTLPFIGITILAYDFLPVVTIILVILMLGMWGSMKSVVGPLKLINISNDPEKRKICQVYFLFFNDPCNDNHTFSKLLMYGAVWLPFVSITIALFLEALPLIMGLFSTNDIDLISPVSVFFRFIFLFLFWVILAVVSNATANVLTSVNREYFSSTT